MRCRLLCGVIVLVAWAQAFAQPLADRVPADAIVYVGWSGSRDMGPGYAGSHLKAVLDQSDIPEFVNEFLPAVMKRIGQEDRDAAEAMQLASEIGKDLWQYPSAFFFGGINLAGQQPAPKAGVLIRAGADSRAVMQRLTGPVEKARAELPFPLTLVQSGDVVAVLVGYQQADLPAGAAKSLSAAPEFVRAVASTQKDAVVAAYLDGEKLLALIEMGVQMSGDPNAAQMYPKIKAALGVENLKQAMFTAGFDGKGWQRNIFVGAPQPRTGLLALFDAKPVSDDAIRLIPQNARTASAASFDLTRALAEIRGSIEKIDPGVRQQLDQTLANISQQLGLDIERDLIGAMGNEWASYMSPTVGGNNFLGAVGINRLRDPAKAEQALGKLTDIANNILADKLRGEDVRISLRRETIGGLKITYLATPFVTPTWTIKNGNLYIALYPQVAATAAGLAGKGGSLLDNPDFAAMRKTLAGGKGAAPSAISFNDLPKAAPDTYAMWLAVSRLAGFGDMFGVPSPAMILPPLDVLAQHLTPSGSAAWSDAAGWHWRSTAPFPGSEILGTDPISAYFTSAGPAAIGVLLPSLNRAREQANRIKSASNLRQVGLGMQMYATENQGKFPKDFEELLKTQDLSPEVLLNPRSDSKSPARGPDRDAHIKAVVDVGDYVYKGAGKNTTATADIAVAYENPEKLRDGINVLYADGHVEFVPMDQARQMINANGQAPARPARREDGL